MLPLLIAPAELVKVEELDFVAKGVAWSGVDLTSTTNEPYKVLRRFMKSARLLYDTPFQVVLEGGRESVAYIFEGKQAVVCVPVYNIRLTVKLSSTGHGPLHLPDMGHFIYSV